MASRWHILLERLGQRHGLLMPVVQSCRSDIASSICPPTATVLRKFCSDLITPTKANQCGGSKQVKEQMAKEVWSFMQSNGVEMNEVSYGCMLSALSRGGCVQEAVDLLHLLYRRKKANVVMYNTVLNGCIRAKSKMYAARCVQLMEAQGVSKDELSYIELIKLAGMRGDLKAARKWWKELNQNFAPSPSSRSPYIIALSRMNAIAEAYEEIQNMVSDLGLETGPKFLDDKEQVLQLPTTEGLSEVGRETTEGIQDVGGMHAQANVVSSNLNLPQGPPVEDSDLHVTEIQEKKLDEGHSTSKKSSLEDPVFSAELPSLGPRLPKNASTSLINVQNAYNSLINAAGRLVIMNWPSPCSQRCGSWA